MKLFFTAVITIFSFIPFFANAQGNLLVLPRRVVFEGSKRTQEVSLANLGNDSARYIISMIQYRMEKDGNFKQINEPDSGQLFADSFIRFFPRSVLLGPNEAQVIKLQLINSSQLKPGEYRSHMYFRALPKISTFAAAQKDTAKENGTISIKLVPQFGISIPVIIRTGVSTAVSSITDTYLKEVDGNEIVHMQLNRTGNMSVFGDVKVTSVTPAGAVTEVGLVKGLAVYTPNTSRTFDLRLDPKAKFDQHKGKLRVVYSSSTDTKPIKLAETEILLK